MPGLLLVLTELRSERAAAAVELAATLAALGRPVGVFLRGAVVRELPGALPPALVTLAELGADLSACQTSLAAHGLDARELPAGVVPSGMVGFLRGRADWQLLLV